VCLLIEVCDLEVFAILSFSQSCEKVLFQLKKVVSNISAKKQEKEYLQEKERKTSFDIFVNFFLSTR
jgi:hypothetical protein